MNEREVNTAYTRMIKNFADERDRAIDSAVESAAQCDRLKEINTDLVAALKIARLYISNTGGPCQAHVRDKISAALDSAKEAMK